MPGKHPICANCYAAHGTWRHRQQHPEVQPASPEERRAFTDALAAALLSDAGMLAELLSPRDSLRHPGVARVVLTIDERIGEMALSTLDKHGMVRPLGLWNTETLWEQAGEIQAFVDEHVEARDIDE